ncbi:MAG TPA: DUF4010 domain-containing protein [Anaeromyxobacter sp.]|nr:DUF4010 domain-containing protein [Anaeromyxobacter sp.]
MSPLPLHVPWPPLETLLRLSLALAVGLFVGLEREWRGKEAGLRTFGIVALVGGVGGLLGTPYAVAALLLVGVLLAFLNLQSLRAGEGTELTTSAALVLTAFLGVLCGLGHVVTPSALAVVAAGLLAWKERLAGFSHRITAPELRSAILLAILTFAIYPLLPERPVDPWQLLAPRAAWLTVILIAAIGFVNYLLWKAYGARGVELTGFLGGLVNSTVTVAELAQRSRGAGPELQAGAFRGILLSTGAMALRNAVLLGVLSASALAASVLPLALILLASAAFGLILRPAAEGGEPTPSLPLESPFSLPVALRYGLVFLALEAVGTLAQRGLGQAGFYAVSVTGGLVSSASAVAAAANLASRGEIAPRVAGVGAIAASLASALVNVVIVARVAGWAPLTRRVSATIAMVLLLGAAGALIQARWPLVR